jgi:hypothetical protein
MDEEQNSKPLIAELLRFFATIFSLSILAISLVGMWFSRYAPNEQNLPGLFLLDKKGLSFDTILQIAIFAAVLAAVTALLFSGRLFGKLRFLWRVFFLLLATLITFSFFALVFKWFPIDDPRTWINFIVCTLICFTLSFCLSLLKLKLEGKKYDRLLANYKARRSYAPPSP